jgi:hypothetical protein
MEDYLVDAPLPGICFLLEAPERAIGRTGGREKGGFTARAHLSVRRPLRRRLD